MLKKYLPDLPPPPFYSKQAETPEQSRMQQLAAELATARLRIQELELQRQELQDENASLRRESILLREQLVRTRAAARKNEEALDASRASHQAEGARRSMRRTAPASQPCFRLCLFAIRNLFGARAHNI